MRLDVFSSMLDEPSPSPPREAPTSAAAHGSAWEVPRAGKIRKYGEKPWEIYGKTRFKLSNIYDFFSFAGKYLEIFLADFPGLMTPESSFLIAPINGMMYHDSIDISELSPKNFKLARVVYYCFTNIIWYILIYQDQEYEAFPPWIVRPSRRTWRRKTGWCGWVHQDHFCSVGEIVGQCLGCFAPPFG